MSEGQAGQVQHRNYVSGTGLGSMATPTGQSVSVQLTSKALLLNQWIKKRLPPISFRAREVKLLELLCGLECPAALSAQ